MRGEITLIIRDINTNEIVSKVEQPNILTEDFYNYLLETFDLRSAIVLHTAAHAPSRFTRHLPLSIDKFYQTSNIPSVPSNPQIFDETSTTPLLMQWSGRWAPPDNGTTRTIRTVALESAEQVLFGVYWPQKVTNAFTLLSTPCIQTDSQVMDIYYRVFFERSPDVGNLKVLPSFAQSHFYKKILLGEVNNAITPYNLHGLFPFPKKVYKTGDFEKFYNSPGFLEFGRRTIALTPQNDQNNIRRFDASLAFETYNGILMSSMLTSSVGNEISAYTNIEGFAQIQNVIGHGAESNNYLSPPFADVDNLATGTGQLAITGTWQYKDALPATDVYYKTKLPEWNHVMITQSGNIGVSQYKYITQPFFGLSSSHPIIINRYNVHEFPELCAKSTMYNSTMSLLGDISTTLLDTEQLSSWDKYDDTSFIVVKKNLLMVFPIAGSSYWKITGNYTELHQIAVINDTIYAACRNTGLWSVNPKVSTVATQVTPSAGIDLSKCHGVARGYNNTLCVVANNGLALYNGTTWTKYDNTTATDFKFNTAVKYQQGDTVVMISGITNNDVSPYARTITYTNLSPGSITSEYTAFDVDGYGEITADTHFNLGSGNFTISGTIIDNQVPDPILMLGNAPYGYTADNNGYSYTLSTQRINSYVDIQVLFRFSIDGTWQASSIRELSAIVPNVAAAGKVHIVVTRSANLFSIYYDKEREYDGNSHQSTRTLVLGASATFVETIAAPVTNFRFGVFSDLMLGTTATHAFENIYLNKGYAKNLSKYNIDNALLDYDKFTLPTENAPAESYDSIEYIKVDEFSPNFNMFVVRSLRSTIKTDSLGVWWSTTTGSIEGPREPVVVYPAGPGRPKINRSCISGRRDMWVVLENTYNNCMVFGEQVIWDLTHVHNYLIGETYQYGFASIKLTDDQTGQPIQVALDVSVPAGMPGSPDYNLSTGIGVGDYDYRSDINLRLIDSTGVSTLYPDHGLMTGVAEQFEGEVKTTLRTGYGGKSDMQTSFIVAPGVLISAVVRSPADPDQPAPGQPYELNVSVCNYGINNTPHGGPTRWLARTEYGWNGSAWIAGYSGSKTTHTTSQPLLNGLSIAFSAGTNGSNFVSGNYYKFGLCNGLLKDNATRAGIKTSFYSRHAFHDVTELTAYTVPAAITLPTGIVAPNYTKSCAGVTVNAANEVVFKGRNPRQTVIGDKQVTGNFVISVASDNFLDPLNTSAIAIGVGKAARHGYPMFGVVFKAGHVFVYDEAISTDLGEAEFINQLEIRRVGVIMSIFVGGTEVYTQAATNDIREQDHRLDVVIATADAIDVSEIPDGSKAPKVTITANGSDIALRAGSSVTNTVSFHSRFYGIDDDLTYAPITVKLNGVSAVVRSNSTLPAPGEVIVDGKMGIFYFNAADIGKTVQVSYIYHQSA